jgi:DEAD/DEAH box helicase
VGPRKERIVDQVVVGTHGKLKNWIAKRILPTRAFKILVFDEADEMLKARCCEPLSRSNGGSPCTACAATPGGHIDVDAACTA